MRKLRPALCIILLAALAPLLLRAWHALPQDNRALVEKKYAGWSGVLRLWIYEGWQPGSGSLSGWLNRCIAGYEKQHPGVYVQPQYVDASAIASVGTNGILPPDMILFPPGLLESPEGLLALEPAVDPRTSLSEAGRWNDAVYAVPVAMGGYIWARDRNQLARIPNTWRGSDAALTAPEDETYRGWGAALLALCSGRYTEARSESDDAGEWSADLDLGLFATPNAPAPTATPVPDAGDTLSCELPEDFAPDPDAWRSFINGDAAAMPVTQREVRRLQALSDQGKGPDWQLATGAAMFSDQLLCLSVVDKPEAQQALCRAFIDHLLTDDCQGELHSAGAFSVTDASSGYTAADPLALMDDALHSEGLCVPHCFGSDWKSVASAIVRKFIAGEGEASALWRQLTAALN